MEACTLLRKRCVGSDSFFRFTTPSCPPTHSPSIETANPVRVYSILASRDPLRGFFAKELGSERPERSGPNHTLH
eukprot:1429791-Rhodomonas_salina.3